MSDKAGMIVTWKCGHCDIIHEQTYPDTNASSRTELMQLVMMIIMNEDEPDFQVRILHEDAYRDETKSIIIALTLASVAEMMSE